MKALVAAMICIILIILPASLGFQDVGGEYGVRWLEEHVTEKKVEETENNSLWTWGNAPKGFIMHNGTVYPPGQTPQWFYPNYAVDSAPIFVNSSALNNMQTSDGMGFDPWLLAQLSGRPVSIASEAKGPLF